MADTVDTDTRSRMMSGIRSKDTNPELIIRNGLHRLGFRFTLHHPSLPGRPDIVFPSRKAAVLVNGCFWHGHDCHLFRKPASRPEFWNAKIERNRNRDAQVIQELNKMEWRVLIIWECAIKGRTKHSRQHLLENAACWLRSSSENSELKGASNGAS